MAFAESTFIHPLDKLNRYGLQDHCFVEMRFQVIVEKNPEGGFTASCVEIPGAISQGETSNQALTNVREAIELILDVRRKAARKGPGQLKMVEVDA